MEKFKQLKKKLTKYIYITIKKSDYKKAIIKLSHLNINIYDLKFQNQNCSLKIKYNDLIKINKYYVTLEYEINEYTGLWKLYYQLKRNSIIIGCAIISFLFVCLASYYIVDVEVIHEDKDLVKLISNELDNSNIHPMSFRKSFNYLQEVKEKIKEKHQDKIDWLEINKVGMRYVVRVEERIITKKQTQESYCGVYAIKDGLVKGIKVYNGIANVDINDYVHKGDLLISGDITLNDEVISHTCANGEVDAEVWYKVNTSVPFNYIKYQKTGKKRNNIIVAVGKNEYQILKNRLENYESKKELIFDALGIKIYRRNDYEVKKIIEKYTEEEAIQKGLDLAKEKLAIKLNDKNTIVSEKILQKTSDNSKIELEVFIVVRQQIGKSSVIKEETLNDP